MNLTSEKIECIAKELLDKYRRSLDIGWDIFSVSPVLVAKLLGLEIKYVDFGEESEVLGFTSFCPMELLLTDKNNNEVFVSLTGKTIIINEALKNGCKGRYHFTIMHEIAHHILNEIRPDYYSLKFRTKPQYIRNNAEYCVDEDESKANMLASAILMPKEFIETVFVKAFEKSYVKRIHSVLDRTEFLKFKAISDLFGVSKEALAIRLQKLGLLGEYRNVSVNSVLDIFPENNKVKTA
jgi:Zn-dependent peptidase ImmA (M78 family)